MKELKIGKKIISIDNNGNIFHKSKELPRTDNGKGYLTVFICYKRYYAHRLVLIAFSGMDMPGMDCNHKNGIKADNRPENLEWATRSQNIAHSYRILKREHAKPQLGKGGILHHRSRAVIQKNLISGEVIKIWGSINEAASHFNIQHGNITKAITGRQGCKQSCGYKWSYT